MLSSRPPSSLTGACFDAVGAKQEVHFTKLTIPSSDEYTSGVCGKLFHSVEEVATKLLPLTRAGEIGKAKYRGSKNKARL
jgi:hypothetical protein